MREEKKETYKKLLTDELPVECNFTGTGRLTNQLYGGFGTLGERFESYDYSFQCHQFDDRISLYIITSGNKFSEYAKEKLVAEILFGQFNNNSPEDIKSVLRQSFASLERDYSNWTDEYSPRHVGGSNEAQEENYELFNGIHILVALIYNNKLYTCNMGSSRIILCKTDQNNVLRAVKMSADFGNSLNNSNHTTSFTNLEIVGPILLDETHRFLVLLSFGLCKTLEEVYDHENINREVIQAIVQQFRTKPSLKEVSQTVIERIISQYYAKCITQTSTEEMKTQTDLTLMVRNFNFLMPNVASSHQERAISNPVNRDHLLTNATMAPFDHSSSIDTAKSSYTNSSTTTSSSNRSEIFDKNIRISPYINFGEYYKNVNIARCNGTLPTMIQFT